MEISGQLPSRKEQHVALVTSADVRFKHKTAGFDTIELEYNALPELNYSDIDTSVNVFGTRCSMPFFIACMTGGYEDAERINATLAEVAHELSIPLGVGSMRAALENPSMAKSFSVVRSIAPTIPIMANIGVVQCIRWKVRGQLENMIASAVEMISASALTIHINPLQELLQPEGEPEFRGALDAIATVVQLSPVPVTVKEVGAGLGIDAVRHLVTSGVRIVDVAGAGGTSWAGVEILRGDASSKNEHLWDVGIPTAQCLRDARHIIDTTPGTELWASGGIMSGTDAAKAIALGAHLCSSARPMLQAIQTGGKEAAIDLIKTWELHLRQWMFLTGSTNINQLRSARIVNKDYR